MGTQKSVFIKGSNYTGKQDKFHPIEDNSKINMILSEAADNGAQVVLWTKGQEHVVKTTMTSLFVPKRYLYLQAANPDEISAVTKYLAEKNDPECQMLIYQPNRAVIGFRCAILRVDGNGVQISFPEMIYRVQRRQHQRYSIRSGYQIEVSFRDPADDEELVQAKVLDISVGGLAMVVPAEDAKKYHVGMQIEEMEIEIRNRTLRIDCRVQNTKEIKADSGTIGRQIGCAFTGISFDDIEFLSFYIGEQTSQFSK